MSRLDLLIAHPGSAHGIYGPLGDQLTAIEPPVWARIIAGYCRDRGFSVKILDAEAEGISPDKVAAWVDALRPKLVVLAVYGHQPSGSSQQMVAASTTVKAIKKRCIYHVPVVMVGGHVSALPERTLNEEQVDAVVIGEGPASISALLEGKPASEVPGLMWRDWRGIHRNEPAPLVEDLAEYHGNVWDLLPVEKYRSHNWQVFGDMGKRQPYASIYTSLGCPYKCSFCCINAPFGTNRYRMRKPEAVVAEIVMLREKYGVRTLKIVDEMYVLNKQHYTAIAEGLIDSGISDELNLWSYARVDTVKPETLALLRKAGMRWLALGIESGSKYVRDGAQKRLKNDDIVGVVRAIQAAGINVIGNFIFGLPDDTVETMQETLDLALELNCEFANFYSAMAYPGSPLYAEAVAKGWALPETWRGYSQHNDDSRPLDTLHVPASTVLRFRDEAFQTYFGSNSYQDMILKKFGEDTLDHVKRMLGYKLRRKLLEPAEAAE